MTTVKLTPLGGKWECVKVLNKYKAFKYGGEEILESCSKFLGITACDGRLGCKYVISYIMHTSYSNQSTFS